MNYRMYPVTLVCCIQILYLSSYVDGRVSFSGFKRRIFGTGECRADEKEPWSYSDRNGPMFWGDTYPECNGEEQSPIAINTRKASRDPTLPRLWMNNYDIPVTQATIENTGYTVQITPTDGVERRIFVNNSNYRLQQLHFHWGYAYFCGAEHTLDGMQFSMELHLVHQNANNQLAVVGVFYQESRNSNSEIQTMIEYFPKVLYKDTRAQLASTLYLNNLVPANPSSYFRYDGSLTTPECTEGVTWSVLTKPLPVGKKQMAEFRKLYSATKKNATPKCKLSNNYRPVQPLNYRQVTRSV